MVTSVKPVPVPFEPASTQTDVPTDMYITSAERTTALAPDLSGRLRALARDLQAALALLETGGSEA